MDTDDTKKTIRRPVVQVQSTGQMALFDRPHSGSAPHQKARSNPKLKFVDPDPEALAFGDSSLRHYLSEAGLEFAFVMGELFDALDWSSFEARYKPGGRPPYSPKRMASLIVYGISQGASSLRALEQLARRDLVALWLTGGLCPDHSKLGRFINLHQQELGGEFFDSMTQAVLKRLPETNREIAGDGTVIKASASRYVQIKKEAAQAWAKKARQDCDDDPDDSEKRQEAQRAKRCVEVLDERAEARRKNRSGDPDDVRVNPSEPDAYIHKLKRGGGFGFAYIPGVMANRQRIIVSQGVHPSSEKAMLDDQFAQAERNLGQSPDRVCLDSGYYCYDVLKLAHQRNLDLLCPPKSQRKKPSKSAVFPKHEFDYNPQTDTYRCPAGETMECSGKGYNKRSQQSYKYFTTPKCNDGCKLRDQCTRAKRGRRIKRMEHDDLAEAMHQVMDQARAQRAYSHRQSSVEPVFAELRGVQGLNRFHRKGLEGVRVEFALHAMAHNLRRLQVLAKEQLYRAVTVVLTVFSALSAQVITNLSDSSPTAVNRSTAA